METQAGTAGPALPPAGSARGAISPSSGHSAAKPEKPPEFRGACFQGPGDAELRAHPHTFLWEIRFKETFRIEG